MKKTVDVDGQKVELEIISNDPSLKDQEEKEYAPSKELSFAEWIAKTPVPTAQGAWNYKQSVINEMMQDWQRSVLWGKDELKKTINKVHAYNHELKREINVLEGKNQQLQKELDEVSRPVQNSF